MDAPVTLTLARNEAIPLVGNTLSSVELADDGATVIIQLHNQVEEYNQTVLHPPQNPTLSFLTRGSFGGKGIQSPPLHRAVKTILARSCAARGVQYTDPPEIFWFKSSALAAQPAVLSWLLVKVAFPPGASPQTIPFIIRGTITFIPTFPQDKHTTFPSIKDTYTKSPGQSSTNVPLLIPRDNLAQGAHRLQLFELKIEMIDTISQTTLATSYCHLLRIGTDAPPSNPSSPPPDIHITRVVPGSCQQYIQAINRRKKANNIPADAPVRAFDRDALQRRAWVTVGMTLNVRLMNVPASMWYFVTRLTAFQAHDREPVIIESFPPIETPITPHDIATSKVVIPFPTSHFFVGKIYQGKLMYEVVCELHLRNIADNNSRQCKRICQYIICD